MGKTLILSVSLLLAGCQNISNPPEQTNSAPEQPASTTPQDLSLQLVQGMTQSEVLQTLKYKPNSASLTTCGGNTQNPWQCEIWDYTDGINRLDIYFVEIKGNWLVNSWGVY